MSKHYGSISAVTTVQEATCHHSDGNSVLQWLMALIQGWRPHLALLTPLPKIIFFPLSLTLGHLEYEKPLNQIETTLIHHTYINGFNNYFT